MSSMQWKVGGYVLGIGILLILISKIDIGLLAVIIENFSPLFLILVIILRLLGIFLSSVNIKVLLDATKKVNILNLFRYQLLRFAGSTVIPFSLSTIPFVYVLNKRENIKMQTIVSVLAVDRIISILLSIGLLFIALLRYFNKGTSLTAVYAFFGVIVVMYMLFYAKITKKIVKTVFPKKFGEYILDITRHYRYICRVQKSAMGLNMLSTLATFIANGVMVLYAFKALGYDIPLVDAVLITNVTQIAVFLPVTPGGLGLRQAIGVYFFSLKGIPLTMSLAMYTLLLIVKYSIAAVCTVSIKLPKGSEKYVKKDLYSS